MYKKGLFHDWVPKPLQVTLIIILFIPIIAASGIYTSNSTDMVGWLGALPEDITFANYANTIGTIITLPIIMRIKQYFTSKQLLVSSLMISAFLNYIFFSTDSASVIIVCSFIMGFVKIFALMEVVIPIMIMISPQGERGRFYPFFYPISIGMGQLTGFLTASAAYHLQWQYAHLYTVIAFLACALLAMVFMHGYRGGKKIPLHQVDWLSALILAISFLFLDYILVYAKQQGWLNSLYIRSAIAGFVLTLLWFIKRQWVRIRHYMNLQVLGRKHVFHAIFMIFLMGAFVAAGSLQSQITAGVWGYDSYSNSILNMAMIPGSVLGGIVCFQWLRRQKSLKVLALLGFGSFWIYTILFYFLIAPVIEIEYLIIPNMLRGFGLTVLYITLGIYAAGKMQMNEMLSSSTILVGARSFMGNAFFTMLFSWLLYQFQWQHINLLGGQMDIADPFIAARGGGMALYGTLQIQGLLTAMKELFGYIIAGGILVLLYVLIHRFGNTNPQRLILIFRRFYGEENKNEAKKATKDVLPTA